MCLYINLPPDIVKIVGRQSNAVFIRIEEWPEELVMQAFEAFVIPVVRAQRSLRVAQYVFILSSEILNRVSF